MTNNTINNVPRELLDSLLTVIESNGYAADEVEVVDELRGLLSAPSPAGVDGLEVVGYSYGNGILINDTTQPDNPMYTKLVRLSDAQAIIDVLREDRDSHQRACIRAMEEHDQQARRIGELEGLLREWRRMFDGGLESGQLGVLRGQTDAALSELPK